MKSSQFLRTLKSDFKRCIKLLPQILVISVLFIIAGGFLLKYSSSLLFGQANFSQVDVAYYMPNDSKYNSFGLNLINNMKSFQDSLNIIEVPDIDEGYNLLNENEVTAFIIIPENFIKSIMNGDNNPVKLVFRDTESFEGYVVNDLMISASGLLGTAQAAVYTMHDVCIKYELPMDTNMALQSKIDSKNLTYVLARDAVFSIQNYDSVKTYSVNDKLTASFILMIFFMMSFVLTSFYKSFNTSYYIRQKISGLNEAKLFLSQSLASSLLIYAAYIFIFIFLILAKEAPSCASLITIIPVIFLVSCIINFITKLVSTANTANIIIFILVLLLLYLAGGIMPIEFLPLFLQKSAIFNPFTYMIHYILICVF